MNDLVLVPDRPLAIPTFSATPHFIERCEDALASSGLVARVTNEVENKVAVGAQRELTGLAREIETGRKRAKEPVLLVGRAIDDAARRVLSQLEPEMARITELVASFADQERRRAALETERIERERKEAERAALQARQAEESRIKAEAEAALKAARGKAAREAAIRAAEEARRKADDEQFRRMQEATERAALDIQAHAPAKAEGQTTRTEWEVNIVDIWALARGHPACVKIEPRLSEIKSLLDEGVKVAGVTARRVTMVSVRTAGKALEV